MHLNVTFIKKLSISPLIKRARDEIMRWNFESFVSLGNFLLGNGEYFLNPGRNLTGLATKPPQGRSVKGGRKVQDPSASVVFLGQRWMENS